MFFVRARPDTTNDVEVRASDPGDGHHLTTHLNVERHREGLEPITVGHGDRRLRTVDRRRQFRVAVGSQAVVLDDGPFQAVDGLKAQGQPNQFRMDRITDVVGRRVVVINHVDDRVVLHVERTNRLVDQGERHARTQVAIKEVRIGQPILPTDIDRKCAGAMFGRIGITGPQNETALGIPSHRVVSHVGQQNGVLGQLGPDTSTSRIIPERVATDRSVGQLNPATATVDPGVAPAARRPFQQEDRVVVNR